MTPIKLPQVQACDSWTLMPAIGEADGGDDGRGDDDGAGGDSKRSSCIGVASFRHRLLDAPVWDYVRFAKSKVVPID